jgi:hypothetical protein
MNENEHDALTAELERLQVDLAGLRSELDIIEKAREARGDQSRYREHNPRRGELLCDVPALESQIDAVKEQLTLLDKTDEFFKRARESGVKATAAQIAMVAAEKQSAELGAKIVKLQEKIDALQAERSNAESKASEAEEIAARKYAIAIAAGSDKKAEAAALTELRKAQEITSAILSARADNERVISALTAEIESLEGQALTAKEGANDQRSQMYRAVMDGLEGQWDDEVSRLVSIGAKLAKAAQRAGIPHGLHQLHVPVFNPSSVFIGKDTLDRMADEIDDTSLIVEITKEAKQ